MQVLMSDQNIVALGESGNLSTWQSFPDSSSMFQNGLLNDSLKILSSLPQLFSFEYTLALQLSYSHWSTAFAQINILIGGVALFTVKAVNGPTFPLDGEEVKFHALCITCKKSCSSTGIIRNSDRIARSDQVNVSKPPDAVITPWRVW